MNTWNITFHGDGQPWQLSVAGTLRLIDGADEGLAIWQKGQAPDGTEDVCLVRLTSLGEGSYMLGPEQRE